VGSNPTGGRDVCLLWVLCVVRERSLRRADHSRGVLPTVVRRCVWSKNLVNEEASAHWGAVAPKTMMGHRIWLINSIRPLAYSVYGFHEWITGVWRRYWTSDDPWEQYVYMKVLCWTMCIETVCLYIYIYIYIYIFSLSQSVQACSKAHPAPFSIGKGAKRSGSEADLSPPPSIEVRNGWSRTSVLPYEFMIGRGNVQHLSPV